MTVHRISDREEIRLAAFLEDRVERSHRRDRKRIPRDSCVLRSTAEQLIRRIVKAAADRSETWVEANNEAAQALHLDGSTVVGTVRRMSEVASSPRSRSRRVGPCLRVPG